MLKMANAYNGMDGFPDKAVLVGSIDIIYNNYLSVVTR